MNTPTTTSPNHGPLYHGTRRHRAGKILLNGFRRATTSHYLGTGICMTESVTTAYEYGEYESGGCILVASLAPNAGCMDRADMSNRENWFQACDRLFVESGHDAMRLCGGNMWVVWNPAVLVAVRRLTHKEALRLMCQEFDGDGPGMGYNGIASEYASIWWGQEGQDVNLTRFPEDCLAQRNRLLRSVGRCRSALAQTANRCSGSP